MTICSDNEPPLQEGIVLGSDTSSRVPQAEKYHTGRSLPQNGIKSKS